MSETRLDPCGCCQGAPPPKEISNRPGLEAIDYRIGTFGSFRAAMIEAIAADPALHEWTARGSDDLGIATLEMWAYLGDILTFYQERTANEAFLRTALLPESVRRLAALLDYKPAPGKAAKTYLALTLEPNKQFAIPTGLKVQSVPGPGEKPQKFETIEPLAADAAFNQVRIYPEPVAMTPAYGALGSDHGYVSLETADWAKKVLQPGDPFVLYSPGTTNLEEKTVAAWEEAPQRALLRWQPVVQAGGGLGTPQAARVERVMHRFAYNAPARFFYTYQDEFQRTRTKEIQEGETFTYKTSATTTVTVDYSFTLPPGSFTNWILDAAYEDLQPGARLLFRLGGTETVQEATVAAVTRVTRTKGAVTATVALVTLDAAITLAGAVNLRDVEIYQLAGPSLTFTPDYYPDTLAAAKDTFYLPPDLLTADQQAALSGRTLILDDGLGTPQVVKVISVSPVIEDFVTVRIGVQFAPALTAPLASATAVFYGNVARATHGETVANEVLGNGDASAAFQSFKLKKSPVTFVPDPAGAHGAANTLRLRVNDVAWQEAPSFYGHEGDEQIFTTEVDEAGVMTVRAGDGLTGARLPTGRSNVVATYRQGLGLEGNVAARQVTTVLTRPPGLKSATNLQKAEGGEAPESLDQARRNAPDTVRTFDRVVSLRDFEDAARDAGMAKARAVWEWQAGQRTVRLTVAGQNGVQPDDTALQELRAYLDLRRDPFRRLLLQSYTPLPVLVSADVLVDERYIPEQVQAAAWTALTDYLAFDNRDLGQPVYLSDVYRVLHTVPGVLEAQLSQFMFKPPHPFETTHAKEAWWDELLVRGVSFASGPTGLAPEPVQARLLLYPEELARLEDPVNDAIVNARMTLP